MNAALVEASGEGHLEIVQMLLRAGANINAFSDSYTPLTKASRGGQTGVVRLLVDVGADITLAVSGLTPLGWAGEVGMIR